MKVYTSYFANGKKLHEAGIMMIGIALFPPKWFYGVSLQQVAPTYSILHEDTEERYVERFKNEVLAKVDPKEFIENVKTFSKGKDVALCCFEKPGDFCHRHLVADWLNEKLGLGVEEFGVKVSKNPHYIQGSLF